MDARLSTLIVAASLIAFVASLALPTTGPYNGIGSLMFGPLAALVGELWAAVWLANPTYGIAVALLFAGRPLPALVVAIVAIALATIAFFIPTIMVDEGGTSVPSKLGAGYYAWLGAMVILVAAAIARLVDPGPAGS